MSVLDFPIEKIKKGIAHECETMSDFIASNAAYEEIFFEINNALLFEKVVNKKRILIIKADYDNPDDYTGIFEIKLLENGIISGNAKYISSNGTILNELRGSHYLYKSQLLLQIIEIDNKIKYKYVIGFQIKHSTIKLFKRDIFNYPNKLILKSLNNSAVNSYLSQETSLSELISTIQKGQLINAAEVNYEYPRLFLMSELIRIGWSIRQTSSKQILYITFEAIEKLVYIHKIQQRGSWLIKYNKYISKSINVFVVVPDDPMIEISIFMLPGTTLIKWIKASNGELKISTKDAQLIKYANNWSIFD